MTAVGFTGSRTGMTPQQVDAVRILLHQLGASKLHHGDCRGSDERVNAIAGEMGIHRIAHPPTSTGLRAYCQVEEIRGPKPFLVRNHDIVLESSVLIATPDAPMRLRSGTWSTIRYAIKVHVLCHVVMPSGLIELRGG